MAEPPWPFPPGTNQRNDIGRIVRSVLASKRFHHGVSFWQRIGNWLEAALRWLVDRLASPISAAGHAGGPWAAAAVVVVLAVLLFLVVKALVQHGLPSRVRKPPRRAKTTLDHEAAPRTAAEWFAEAERLAAAGSYREAMRCRYRAVVCALAERGTLQEVPGLTAGAYSRLVAAADPDLAPAFSEVTSRFETSWYGRVPVGEADDSDLDGLARRVLERVAP